MGKTGIDIDAEITTEANPESTSVAFLAELANLGVNRLSMGVQSFDDEVLAVLDRTHSKDHVGLLVGAPKSLAMRSASISSMEHQETIQSWEATSTAL